MLNYILKPARHQSFFKKYASKKFLKVSRLYVVILAQFRLNLSFLYQASIFVRDWALERWEENTQVDLLVELPVLKAIIQDQRAAEEQIAQANGTTGSDTFQER